MAPLLDAAGIGVEDRVLDIGCGTGTLTRPVARRARRGDVVGIDLSDRARWGAGSSPPGALRR